MKGGLLGLVLLGTILAIEAKILLGDFKKKDANRVMPMLESFPKENRVENESKEIDNSSSQDKSEEDKKDNEKKPDKKSIKQKNLDSSAEKEAEEEKNESGDLSDVKETKKEDNKSDSKKNIDSSKDGQDLVQFSKKNFARIGNARQQFVKDDFNSQLWRINNERLETRLSGPHQTGLTIIADYKYSADALREGDGIPIILIPNTPPPPRQQNGIKLKAEAKASGKKAIKSVNTGAATDSEKWNIKKYRIEKYEWFTVQSKLSKHFLTAPKRTTADDPLKDVYVNFEIPIPEHLSGTIDDAQLWIMEEVQNEADTFTLKNKKGDWKWMAKKWKKMPKGEPGMIESIENPVKVLTNDKDADAAGDAITLIAVKGRATASQETQYWKIGDIYHSGYFTIKKYHFETSDEEGIENLQDLQDLYLTSQGANGDPTLESRRTVTPITHSQSDHALWKIHGPENKIESKSGVKLCDHCSSIPDFGVKGNIIRELDDNLLSTQDDVKGSKVVWQARITVEENIPKQEWTISNVDAENFFTFTNVKSNQILYGYDEENILNGAPDPIDTALWKKDNNILKNKEVVQIAFENWQIPESNAAGYITHTGNSMVLGLEIAEEGASAKWQNKIEPPTNKLQQWKRSVDLNGGYFTLRSEENEDLLLHAEALENYYVGRELYKPTASYEDDHDASVWHFAGQDKVLTNDKGVTLVCSAPQCFDPKSTKVSAVVHIKKGDQVYGLFNQELEDGSVLEWQSKNDAFDTQKWERSRMDSDSKFRLKNVGSNLYLHGHFKDYYTNGPKLMEFSNVPKTALWKIKIVNNAKKIVNDADFELCTNCEIPHLGKAKGVIKHNTNVMGLKDGKTDGGTEVVWEAQKNPASDTQHWVASKLDTNQKFTLESVAGGKLLHSNANNKFMIGSVNPKDTALWKLENGKMKNKDGTVLEGKWKYEDPYIIEDKENGKVLGIEGNIKDGAKVIPQEKKQQADNKQMWEKSDVNGYFTLKSKASTSTSDFLLHANKEKKMFVGSKTYVVPKPTQPPVTPKPGEKFEPTELWKYDKGKKTLMNEAGTVIEGITEMPDPGQKGFVAKTVKIDNENVRSVLSLELGNDIDNKKLTQSVHFFHQYKAQRAFDHRKTQHWIRTTNIDGKEYFRIISAYNQMELHANKDKKLSIGGVLPLEVTGTDPKTPKPDSDAASRLMSNVIPILMLATSLVLKI